MLEVLNTYYNKKTENEYNVILSFINTKNTIVKKEIFLVNSSNNHDAYLDSGDYLKNMYNQTFFSNKKFKDVDEYTDIKKITSITRYFSLVRIENDMNTPENNGKTMIFYFRKSILNMIEDYIGEDNNKLLSNSFHLNVRLVDYKYYNFDHSSFILDKNFTLTDYSLGVENEIKIKTYVPTIILNRKDKILKLKEKICSKLVIL